MLLPRDEWPDEFSEDPECPGLGVWSCGRCKGNGVEPETQPVVVAGDAGRKKLEDSK